MTRRLLPRLSVPTYMSVFPEIYVRRVRACIVQSCSESAGRPRLSSCVQICKQYSVCSLACFRPCSCACLRAQAYMCAHREIVACRCVDAYYQLFFSAVWHTLDFVDPGLTCACVCAHPSGHLLLRAEHRACRRVSVCDLLRDTASAARDPRVRRWQDGGVRSARRVCLDGALRRLAGAADALRPDRTHGRAYVLPRSRRRRRSARALGIALAAFQLHWRTRRAWRRARVIHG
eukprot:6210236-Pleurochrysis_carterae.AAC.2